MVPVALALGALAASASVPGLNVVHILMDDWGWGDAGVYGSPDGHQRRAVLTPHIDALANSGVLFTDYHSASSVCSPSRAGWMTSRYPAELGIHTAFASDHADNAKRGMPDQLDPATPNIARLLKEQLLYTTAHFGKWHLGGTKAPVASPAPTDYGFDHSATFNSNAEWLDPRSPPLDPTCPSPRMPMKSENASVPWCDNPYWSGDSSAWTVNHSLGFIANATATQTPFYLNAWFHVSHAALVPRPEHLAVYDEAATCRLCAGPQCIPGAAPMQKSCPSQIFMASQSDADTQIGRLIASLAEHRITERTIVALSTDNGPEERAVFTNGAGNTGPFRGQKRSLYEGGIRLPFIVRLPGSIRSHRVDHSVVGAVDWLPTIAAMTGLKIDAPTQATLSGIDLSPILLQKPTSGNMGNYSYTPRPTSHPLLNEWRFAVAGPCVNGAPRLAIRDNELKLLLNPPTDTPNASSRVELYHLPPITDPNLLDPPPELQNLAHDPQHAADVHRLTAPLMAWFERLPKGPHDPAHGCAGYRFPTGRRAAPDGELEGAEEIDADKAAWWD